MTKPAVSSRTDGTRLIPSLALALAIASPAAWSIAVSRWGSYIGVGPIFVTDVLVAIAIASLCIGMAGSGPLVPVHARGMVWFALCLLLYCAVRLVGNWYLDASTFRDLAPFAYVALLPVSLVAVSAMPPASRTAVGRLLTVSLAVHALWFSLSQLSTVVRGVGLSTWEVAPGIQVFQVRTDVDTALAGLFVALLVIRGFTHGFTWRVLVLAAITGAGMTMTGSRAGLLGGTAAIFGALLHLAAPGVLNEERRRFLRSSVPLLACLAVVSIGVSSIGERIISTFGGQVSAGVVGGQGTTTARLNAWTALIDWLSSETWRNLFGVGFGPDFMKESGALRLLVGDGTGGVTRSPHNYWLGIWARLGILGMILAVVVVVHTARVSVAAIRRGSSTDQLAIFSSLLVISLLLPATLGVVLESPFGAVPFFWCSGVVLGCNALKS